MRYQGQLVEWNDEQGYGFIQPLDRRQSQKIFMHIKSFAQRGPRPIIGAMLEYNVALDSQGRHNAQQVSYVLRKQTQQNHINQNQPNQKHSSQQRNRQAQLKQNQFKQHWRGWLITVYAVLIIALVMTQQLPLWVLIVPVLLSGLNYAFYTTDKQ
ncbi:MAG: cold shock domain-containing protein, partial [Moraxellaceae bacterium]